MTAVILVCWMATAGMQMQCERIALHWDAHLPVNLREVCESWIFNKEIEVLADGAYLAHAICVPGDVA
jgi:hypothetical protein